MGLPITILIEISGEAPGTPGASRVEANAAVGKLITCTDPANFAGGGTWSWTLAVPAGSATTPSGASTNTMTFTPDIPGTYLVFLVYDDGVPVQSWTDGADGDLISTQGGLDIAQANGNRLPGIGETKQFTEWASKLDGVLRPIDGQLPSVDEKGALAGTGTPSAGNPFVTDDDARLSDARTPTAHASSHQNAGADTLAADVVRTTSGPTDMVVGAIADGEYLVRSGSTIVGGTPAGTDELVKVSADDTTAGRLEDKIVAGTGISLATLNPAGNEQLEITATGGGGGSVAAAQGAYIHAALSADQLNPAISAVVDFDTTVTQRGGITVDGSGRFSTLKAGRTYLLEAALGITDSGAALVEFQWYNVTGAAYLTSTFGQTITPTSVTSTASFPVAGTIITPTEDIQVELHVTGKFATPDILSDRSWARIIEIGAVQANVIGGLEYLDTIEVTGDVTSVTFGAGGDGVLGTALDGDADEEYVLSYFLPQPGTSVQYSLQPNGLATNQTGSRVFGGTSTGDNTYSLWPIANLLANESAGIAEVWAKTGQSRFFSASEAHYSNTTQYSVHNTGRWTDTSTNITSLVVFANVASGIKTGARFVLWRRTRNNLRADSASTYERNVEATVAQGTNAEVEYTTGHATFQGSAIGVSVSLNDTVTAGTITVNLKVAGSTVLTAVLDTTNTFFKRTIESVGVHAVAPGDEIIVGIATSGLTTTGGGTPGITVNSTLVNDALVRQTPAVVAQTVLSSPASTISVSGLNGDIDEEYEIEFNYIATGTAAHDVDIRPNGTTGADRYTKRRSGGATWTTTTGILLANGAVSTPVHHRSTFRCYVKRSVYQRRFVMNAVMTYSSTIVGDWDSWTTYSDGAANLTSLEFGITNVQFAAGSEIIVRRVVK